MESITSFVKSFFKNIGSKLSPSTSPTISEPQVEEHLPLYPPELTVVPREGWGAQPAVMDLPDDPLLPLCEPVKKVFLNDTATLMCDNLEECKTRLLKIQWNHQDGGWPDITHNFMIGFDNNVYVGRGWDWHPDAMWQELKGDVIDICFIGNFERLYPTPPMMEVAEKLIAHGVKINRIDANYEIVWFRPPN